MQSKGKPVDSSCWNCSAEGSDWQLCTVCASWGPTRKTDIFCEVEKRCIYLPCPLFCRENYFLASWTVTFLTQKPCCIWESLQCLSVKVDTWNGQTSLLIYSRCSLSSSPLLPSCQTVPFCSSLAPLHSQLHSIFLIQSRRSALKP